MLLLFNFLPNWIKCIIFIKYKKKQSIILIYQTEQKKKKAMFYAVQAFKYKKSIPFLSSILEQIKP